MRQYGKQFAEMDAWSSEAQQVGGGVKALHCDSAACVLDHDMQLGWAGCNPEEACSGCQFEVNGFTQVDE